MAATFAVFADLALLLQCLFLLPSGLHSAFCVNVTLPLSFLSVAADSEFDQLCCQRKITQIRHNNKS